MSDIDKATKLALRTWYPKDHNLHLNPHHPLGKLVGEWGELMDDYMKSLYKPGYEFKPLDELGDIWYYLRILAYQRNYNLRIPSYNFYQTGNTEYLICAAIEDVSYAFQYLERHNTYSLMALDRSYFVLLKLSRRFKLNLDQLTSSNWEKLQPGSERGEQWNKARTTEYVGGKIAKGN